MKISEAIRLRAFLNALGQLDSLPPELAPGLREIRFQLEAWLETDPIAAISELENFVEDFSDLHPPLAELYRAERLRLKKQDSEQERNKFVGMLEKNSTAQNEASYIIREAIAIIKAAADNHFVLQAEQDILPLQRIEANPEAESQAVFEKINSLYWIEEPAETLKLLLGHEAMLPLVIEAYDKIRELFAEAKLALEVERDPEIPGWRSLWIMIYSQLDSDEAFKKLKTLDYNWWLDAGDAVGNKLNIDLGWE